MTDGNGVARFQWQPLASTEFEHAVPLFQARLTVREAAGELGISKSACHRLRQRAVEMGVIGA